MNTLFSEFDPADKEVWLQKAIKEINGKDYSNTLGWRVESDMILDPIYTFKELTDLEKDEINQPVFRNVKPGWIDSIPIDLSKFRTEEVIRKIEFLQSWDVQSIVLDARSESLSQNNMRSILESCRTGTSLFIKDQTDSLLAWHYQWIQVCQTRGFDPNNLIGGLLADPYSDYDNTFSSLKDLFAITLTSPNLYLLGISVEPKNSLTQELSEGISNAHNIFCRLAENGITTQRLVNTLLFNVSINQLYVEQAAKLMALRTLWGSICSEYGIESCRALIMTECSSFPADKVHDDNLIRETLVAMSSIMGGTDILNISPVKDDNDALRWAMNIHHLLKHESRLDLVADVSGGSYAIEKLSKDLVNRSWEQFLKSEMQGGNING